jgi:hypothetical protein
MLVRGQQAQERACAKADGEDRRRKPLRHALVVVSFG